MLPGSGQGKDRKYSEGGIAEFEIAEPMLQLIILCFVEKYLILCHNTETILAEA